GVAGARFRGLRWNLAVRRIDDEPGATVLRVVVLEPVQRAAQLPALFVGLDAVFVALLVEPREFIRRDLGQRLAGERGGPLHRNEAFVAFGLIALQIRIAPWRAWRGERGTPLPNRDRREHRDEQRREGES